MNTTQLECFIHVAHTLNFLSASKQLNMSQPSVSKQIQSLENELGTVLLNRTTRTVSLTAIGQQFLADAENILKNIQASKDKISAYGKNALYSIRIGYSDNNELNFLTDIFKKLMISFPNIHPEFTLNPADINLHKLEQGHLDAVFSVNDHLKTETNILFKALGDITLKCAVSKNHALSDKKTITFDELSNHPQIIFFPYSAAHNTSAGNHVIKAINPQMPLYICNSSSEAIALAKLGLGYTLIPDTLLIQCDDLNYITVPEIEIKEYGIYYNKDKFFNALKEFCKIGKDYYQNKIEISRQSPIYSHTNH